MTRRQAPAVRAGVVAAVGFLLLDAVLLGVAAAWGRRPWLFLWAAVFTAAAVGVLALWRRYLAHLGELDTQRRAMRLEIEHMRAAVRNESSGRA